jgi:hypothetical protein
MNRMKTTETKVATLPADSPARFYLAGAALALALFAIPHAGHAQGIVRGAQEGGYEGNRVVPDRSAAWLALQSAPASAAPSARWMAFWVFPIAAATAAAAITTATATSAVIGKAHVVIPGHRAAMNPESRAPDPYLE